MMKARFVALVKENNGTLWREEGRAWLEERLEPAEDGSVVYSGGTMTSGVLHWKPRS